MSFDFLPLPKSARGGLLRHALCSTLLVTVTASPALADLTWIGAAGNWNFSATRWDPDNVADPDQGWTQNENAVFNTAGSFTVDINTVAGDGVDVTNMTFDAGTLVTISGETLTVGGTVTATNAGTTVRLDANIDSAVTLAGAGTIRINGGAGAVSATQAGDATINSTVSSLAQSGAGTTTVTAAGTVSGTTTITGGEVLVDGGTLTGLTTVTTGTLDIDSGSVGDVENAATTEISGGSVANLDNEGGTITIDGAATITTLDNNTGTTNMSAGSVTGATTANDGTINLSGGSLNTVTIGGGEVAVTGTGSITGLTTVTSGTLDLDAGSVADVENFDTTEISGGTVANLDNEAASATITIDGAATITTLDNNLGTTNMSAGSVTGATTADGGTINLSGGSLNTVTIDGGEVAVTGTGSIGGLTTVTSGTLDLDAGSVADVENSGTTEISGGSVANLDNEGGTITVDGAATITTLDNNTGTTNMSAGSVSGATTADGGTINLSGAGSLAAVTIDGGEVALTGGSIGGLTTVTSGTLDVDAGSVGGVNNAGTAEIDGGTVGAVSNTGTVTMGAGSVASLSTSGTATLSGGSVTTTTSVTGGELTVSGGTLTGATTVTSGTLDIDSGTVGVVTNSSTAEISGGSVGAVTSSGTVTMDGGSVASLSSSSAATISGGTITGATNVTGGTTSVSGAATLTGATSVTGGATFDVNGGDVGDVTTAAGTMLELGGGSVNSFNASGDVNVDANTTVDTNATFNNNDLTFTNTGVIVALGANVNGAIDEVTVTDVAGASDTLLTYLGTSTLTFGTLTVTNANPAFDYILNDNGSSVSLVTTVDAGLASLAATVGLTETVVGAIVNRPTSPYVADLATDAGDRPCGPGGWVRATGGTGDAEGQFTQADVGINGTTPVEISYAGLQFGGDLACFGGRFNGWDLAFGGFGGFNIGDTTSEVFQLDAVGGTSDVVDSITTTDFTQSYLGGYVTAARGRLTADIQLRFESTDFDSVNTPVAATDSFFDGGEESYSNESVTLSGAVTYAWPLGEATPFVLFSSVGFALSDTATDTIELTGGDTLDLEDYSSQLGFVSATVARSRALPDNLSVLSYFGTATLYNDFADDREASVISGGSSTDFSLTNLGSYTEVSAGLNYLRLLAPGQLGNARQLNAAVRLDLRSGSNVESLGLTGQVRLQF